MLAGHNRTTNGKGIRVSVGDDVCGRRLSPPKWVEKETVVLFPYGEL